jgi:parallel beta-helix repeat protein
VFKENQYLSPSEKFSYENIAFDAYPLIENNVFAYNIGAGIGNNHYSYATILNNEVFGSISKHSHSAPGIGIQHGAHPLVEKNLIYSNDWVGIGCRQGSQPLNRRTCPVIKNNTVMNNGFSSDNKHAAGIGADNAGSADNPVIIENNIVRHNQTVGIGIRNGSFVVISGNHSSDNELAGIMINKSYALVNNNTAFNNKKVGIGCYNGQATILNNYAYGNHMAGIGLHEAKNMVIVENRILKNGTSGYITRTENYSPFQKNKISEKNQVAVKSSDIDEIFIDRMIKRLKQSKLETNYFNGDGGVGIGMKKSKVLEFSNNTLIHNQLPGLAMIENSTIAGGKENLFVENGINNAPNISLLNNSYLALSETKILKGDGTNIYLSGSRLILKECQIEEYSHRSIIAIKRSSLKIDNDINSK